MTAANPSCAARSIPPPQAEGDHLTLLAVYEGWKTAKFSTAWCMENFVQVRARHYFCHSNESKLQVDFQRTYQARVLPAPKTAAGAAQRVLFHTKLCRASSASACSLTCPAIPNRRDAMRTSCGQGADAIRPCFRPTRMLSSHRLVVLLHCSPAH